MQEILDYAWYTVAFLTAALPVLEVAGGFLLPGSLMLKMPRYLKLIRGTIDLVKTAAEAADTFRKTLDQWEKEKGGLSRELDPKLK